MASRDISPELEALTDAFVHAVSFESGQRPAYATIRDLLRLVDSGALTSFEQIETAEITEVFGNIAHRFSTYRKRGTMHQEAI